MSQEETIQHWRSGAQDALEAAELLHSHGKYALALFDCHLAVEKVLKAAFIHANDREPPPTHNLLILAEEIDRPWSDEEKQLLRKLTDYAIDARYDDPEWAKQQATEKNSAQWIEKAKGMLTLLNP